MAACRVGSKEYEFPNVWGLEVYNGEYIEINRGNVVSDIKDFCRGELANNPESKLAYIESCFNDKYSEEILITIIAEIDKPTFPSDKYIPEEFEPIPGEGVRYHKLQLYKAAQIKRSKIIQTNFTIFKYCEENRYLLINHLTDDPWPNIIEELFRYYAEIKKFAISKQSQNDLSEADVFLKQMAIKFPICHKAFKRAMDGGSILKKDDKFDFQCNKGSVGWFFYESHCHDWTEISRNVTICGEEINPVYLRRYSFSPKPKDYWKLSIYLE